MSNRRVVVLILLAFGLGALLWFDQFSGDRSASTEQARVRPQSATTPQSEKREQDDLVSQENDGPGQAEVLNSQATRTLNPLADFKLAALNDWVERPLFAPERAKPPLRAIIERKTVRQVPKVIVPPKPRFVLLGVIRSEDGRNIALMRNQRNGRSIRVEIGDVVSGGWLVEKIDARSLTLSLKGRQELISMSANGR